MEKYSINQILKNQDLLNHNGCWNFYEWISGTSYLEKRAKELVPVIKMFVEFKILDGDKVYVKFKNILPIDGQAYDDIRFFSMENDNFLGGISPKDGNNKTKGKCKIWSFDRNTELEEKTFSSFLEYKRQVRSNPDFVAELQEFFLF